MLERPLTRNAAAALADDDRELAFMMNFAVGQRRQHDGIIRPAEARVRLEEKPLPARIEFRYQPGARLHLVDMGMIVGGIGDDLVGPGHRTIELGLGERDPFGGPPPLEDSRLEVIVRCDEPQHARGRP